MYSCLICSQVFGTLMERAQHVSRVHMGTDGDDVMRLAVTEIEVPLFVGMVAPLSAEEAMNKLRGSGVSMVNRGNSLSLCQNCSGCEICANTWDAKADACFKVPAIPAKRAAQDNAEAGSSKKPVDDYWFCEVANMDTNSELRRIQAVAIRLAARKLVPAVESSQEELRQTINEIVELPSQDMVDSCNSIAVMARVENTPEEEAGVPLEQIGGALGDHVSCPICALVFSNYNNMNRHKIFAHSIMFCARCEQEFKNRAELRMHKRVCDVRGLPTNIPPSEFFNMEIFSALQKAVVTYCFKPKVVTDALVLCLSEFEGFVTPILNNYVVLRITFKVEVSCQVTMHKLTDANTKIHPVFGHRQLRPLLLMQTQDDVRTMLAGELEAIKIWFEEYNTSASNWILESVDYICINCHETDNDAGGAGAAKLPDRIKNSHCVINLETSPDNDCFKYAILAAVHNDDVDNHRERIINYDIFARQYDFSVITYPVNPLQLQLFEKANKTISVWAHYLVKGQARCLYRSTCAERPIRSLLTCFCMMTTGCQ